MCNMQNKIQIHCIPNLMRQISVSVSKENRLHSIKRILNWERKMRNERNKRERNKTKLQMTITATYIRSRILLRELPQFKCNIEKRMRNMKHFIHWQTSKVETGFVICLFFQLRTKMQFILQVEINFLSLRSYITYYTFIYAMGKMQWNKSFSFNSQSFFFVIRLLYVYADCWDSS